MSFNGVRLFRYALLGEASVNLISAVQLIFLPETFLTMLLRSPNQIAPSTITLARWTGALFIALSVPLMLSYPNTKTGIDSRRTTYLTLAAGEVPLLGIAAAQFLGYGGDSGMKSSALLAICGFMGVFLGMRYFFLVMRPTWMDAQANARKAQ